MHARSTPLRDGRVAAAVVFDLDGVLLDSEQLWNESKRSLVEQAGGRWRDDAPAAMMGMSAPEWSVYLRDTLGVPLDAAAINHDVRARMAARYRGRLPLLPGAVEAVRGLAVRWPLALASSSDRPIIDLALRSAGLAECFAATVSSEEVPRGKPAPDVYLEASRRLGVPPHRAVAVEDSANGIRAAADAGLVVIATPNVHYPPPVEALALASLTLPSVAELDLAAVERAYAAGPGGDGSEDVGSGGFGRRP